MKPAQKIKERLVRTQQEIIRISVIITENPEMENEKYDRTSELKESGWTWKEALVAHVAEKHALDWVLNN
jgi:hypothetical protein